MGSKCIMCGKKVNGFRWINLFQNKNSLIEVNLSSYCLRCGNIRIKTLRRIYKTDPEKLLTIFLPEEKV